MMIPEHWRQIEDLYHAAQDLPAKERKAFLDRADPDLRAKVEALLAQEGSELDRPAWEDRGELFTATETMVTSGAQLGPSKVEEAIGVGGMGQVFRAIDTRLNRAVAIKTSTRVFDLRFEREARAIAQLNHPHICTLYDVGANYLVMELLDGETLRSRLKAGALGRDQVLSYGAQIADALATAVSSTLNPPK
jgi:eukaryotic-like serine/threonine-protein kinase